VPKGLPEISSKLNIPVGDNGLSQTVQFGNAIEKILATLEALELQEQGRSRPF